MTQPKTYMDPRLVELLAKIARAQKDPVLKDAAWAIGGAMGMMAHGVRRFTNDIDIFVEPERRHDMIRALRTTGLTVSPVFAPHHYVAMLPKHNDPEIRIDVLAPASDPEESAAQMAVKRPIDKWSFPVFTPEFLVLAKFYSDQPGALGDIALMLDAGIVDQGEAVRLLLMMSKRDAGVLKLLFKRLAEPRVARPRPKRRSGR